jgi:hypothetical protein
MHSLSNSGVLRAVSICTGLTCAFALVGCTPASDEPTSRVASPATVTVTKTVPARASRRTQTVPETTPAPPLRLESYSGTDFDVDVPAGWTLVKESNEEGGFTRTQWRDPADGRRTLLIDVSLGETGSAADKARSIRASSSATPGYSESFFGPTQMNGRQGFKWIFNLPASRRVDYIVTECGSGFAILGIAPVADFPAVQATYSQVAQTFEPQCLEEELPPEDDYVPTPDFGGDLDCSDFTYQSEAQDYYDDQGNTDGGDPDDLDRDQDGVACEALP